MTNISVKSAKHCLSEFDKASQQTCNQLKTPIFFPHSLFKRRLRTGL
jgi:hypothetical protein